MTKIMKNLHSQREYLENDITASNRHRLLCIKHPKYFSSSYIYRVLPNEGLNESKFTTVRDHYSDYAVRKYPETDRAYKHFYRCRPSENLSCKRTRVVGTRVGAARRWSRNSLATQRWISRPIDEWIACINYTRLRTRPTSVGPFVTRSMMRLTITRRWCNRPVWLAVTSFCRGYSRASTNATSLS